MAQNKQQREYGRAKATLDALEAQKNRMEADYVKGLGVVNEDGTTPRHTWAIDDDEMADRAIEEFEEIVESSGLWAKIVAAREALKTAEENLVQYGLSIMPYKKEREILERAAKTNYTTRQKIVELTMRLDVSTVRR